MMNSDLHAYGSDAPCML